MKSVKSCLFGILAAVLTPSLATSLASAQTAPIWERATLGYVGLHQPATGKNSAKFPVFDDQLTAPVTGSDLLFYVGAQPKSLEKIPQAMLDQVLGLVVLGKILDHEAELAGMPKEVSILRVRYIARAVLAQNATNLGRIRTAEDTSKRDFDEMYGWLKESVGTNNVRFNIDWKYRDGGLQLLQETLASDSPQWGKVRLSFESLPATLKEFETQIAAKLQPTYSGMRKREIWRRVSASHISPSARWVAREPSIFDVQRLHAAVKDDVLADLKRGGIENPQFELSDPKVRDAISQKIKQTQQAYLAREAVYALFKENPFFVELNTCSDPAWPCVNADAETLANALFPERLLPGQRLSMGKKSTLGRPTDFYKVMLISAEMMDLLLMR